MIARLRDKGRAYWLISLLILAATIAGRHVIDERLNFKDVHNWLFVLLTRSPTNPAFPHSVRLVAIDDDSFWGDEMQHRAPTNRAYLAKVVAAADEAEASVIGLDFDLRLPHPDAAVRPGDYGAIEPAYRDETDRLMRVIGDVAQRRKIVLSTPIDGPVDGPFTLPAAVPRAYGICTALLGEGRWANPGTPEFPLTPVAQRNIACGYIALMDDTRRVPPPARIVGSHAELDAFPLAIARFRDPGAPERVPEEGYASFIPERAIRDARITIPATRLLRDPAAARDVLQGYPVIIGASWHPLAYGQYDAIDLHDTPIGPVAGALLHLNLAEAVLDGRVFPALPEWAMVVIEVLLGLGAAVLFALMPSVLLATLLLIAAMIVLLGIQWMFLQLFGTLIDLFAPVMGLGVHAILDRLLNAEEQATSGPHRRH